MEPSIDLTYIRRMAYMDDLLMVELLQNWVFDVNERIIFMEQAIQNNKSHHFFKIIHEIKTSFLIIGSGHGLKYCEFLMLNLSNGETLTHQDILKLKDIYTEIVQTIAIQKLNLKLI
ncbi:MAG: hypothetical protein IPK88_06015 [Saprospiraceae bacterium]|nr:hypothetical protein [Candidatus Defluviibacterium haderslevense]